MTHRKEENGSRRGLRRALFGRADGTPDSPLYAFCLFVVRLWCGRRPFPTVRDEKLRQADVPYVMISNHESFFDFYYLQRVSHPKRPAFLVSDFYCIRPVLKFFAKHAGVISKKIFAPDMAAPLRIMRTLRNGYPVVIFPEGRLSPDGRSNPIVEEGAAFFKRLNADLVLVKLRGAYLAYPKWRGKRFRAPVSVTVEEVIKKDALRAMSDEALNRKIAETLYGDASKELLCEYPQKDKARGLDTLLYRCCDCGALYTTVGRGNELACTACGRRHTLNDQYHFTDAPFTIPGWYDRIKDMERAELDGLKLEAAVRTHIYGAPGKKDRNERGVCTLTPETFTYRSEETAFSIPTENMPGMAFSCGKEFEVYHEGELFFFYPEQQPQQAARWALAVDLLTERRRAEKNDKGKEA